MTAEAFSLQPSDIPQPQLLDADPVTTDWPLPEARPFKPLDMSMLARFCRWTDVVLGLSWPEIGE